MEFADIARFHGHECPGLAIGYRMARRAMDRLHALRAGDEELVAIVENDACGVDALQCVSGCTFGKGNLIFRDYGKQVYTLYCRVSRQGVRVVYHGHGVPPGLREDLPALTQFVLGAPESALFSLASVSLREPERARIRASVTCDNCYESVMATRVQEVAGLHLCIPCAEERASGRPATRASVPSCGSSAQE